MILHELFDLRIKFVSVSNFYQLIVQQEELDALDEESLANLADHGIRASTLEPGIVRESQIVIQQEVRCLQLLDTDSLGVAEDFHIEVDEEFLAFTGKRRDNALYAVFGNIYNHMLAFGSVFEVSFHEI